MLVVSLLTVLPAQPCLTLLGHTSYLAKGIAAPQPLADGHLMIQRPVVLGGIDGVHGPFAGQPMPFGYASSPLLHAAQPVVPGTHRAVRSEAIPAVKPGPMPWMRWGPA